MTQFADRAAVVADLCSRHELFLTDSRHSVPTGFYGASALPLSCVLRPYLLPLPPTRLNPTELVRQVQAATCTPPLKPALPIDMPALQRKIDLLIAQDELLPIAA